MKKISSFLIIFLLLSAINFANAQQKIIISPAAPNLKVYVFDTQVKFIKYIPVQPDNSISVDPDEFSKNNYFIVVTSSTGYYIGKSQQLVRDNKIILETPAPMPWVKIADDTKLITSDNQYINVHAHGGLDFYLEKDMLSIIRLKLLGFNGLRLVFRSFNLGSTKMVHYYIKTPDPFNNTINGFTDTYINNYIVPEIQLAKLLGMYVILDHHDMFINDVNQMNAYETNPDEYNAWLQLWDHLSAKFKNESAIAIYEVQNEPGSKMSQDFVLKMHNDVIKIIRKNDASHLIAFGHSWGNITQQFYLDKGIPYDPDKKLIYTMHHYYKTLRPNGGLDDQIADAVKIGRKYNIPIWFGETGYLKDYSDADREMIERWYDYADKNFIWTSLWWDFDVLGKIEPNTDADYSAALNLKKRVYLSETNDWNIRCYRKDFSQSDAYIINNPDPSAEAHIKINYPMMNTISFSPDNSNVKITYHDDYAVIDGKFRKIEVTLK